jgi:enterochelin esterase-like enzyme
VANWLSRLRPAEPWGPYVPPGAGRDLRIDLLRGFAVVAMVVDHIAGPSFFYAVTGGNRFYTSAAEGFIFISGLVMGLVYQRLIDRDGLGPSLRRAIERSATLYLLTITLTLLFVPLSEILPLHWAQGLDFSRPAEFVVSVLTLHRTYYLVDIPLLYTLLIIISPLALTLLSQGRTALVITASWLLWAAYQFFPEQADVPWAIAGNYLFFLAAWQVLFFTGLSLGWHHATLTTRLAGLPRRALLVASGLGFAGLVLLYRFSDRITLALTGNPDRATDLQLFLLESVFAKSDLRIGRIVASVVVFGFLYLLVTELWQPLYRWLGWLLMPLGQSALYAYAAHVVLAVPVALVLDHTAFPDRYARPLNAAVQVGIIGLIWAGVRWHVVDVNPSRGRARYVWPVAAVIACMLLLPLDPSPTMPGAAEAAFEPDPYQDRVRRAFGTPIPGRPPRDQPTQRLPAPDTRRAVPARGGAPPVSEYVGAIRGTLRNIQFYSPSLDRDMPYFVYLPPGYDDEGRRYPVLFMLHGNSGSYEEWAAYGLIDRADRMIVNREILPLILVLPQGDYGYWVNHIDDGPAYGDYLSGDLVRHVNATYRILPGPENHAVGGLSMGATGALINALRNPDVWGVVGAHSPSLPAEGERDFLGLRVQYQRRDPISIVPRAVRVEGLKVWVDIGDEDMWVDRATELHELMEQRDLEHEWNVWIGDHDEDYWASHVPDYLRFYDRALNPQRRF